MSNHKINFNTNGYISWASFFLTSRDLEDELPISSDALKGVVCCSVCNEHFDNAQFFNHILQHMLINELYQGTLLPYEFCPECLSVPINYEMDIHRALHCHVRKRNPLALFSGSHVCPICELCFETLIKFATHLYERHVHHDSPYVCTICYKFRSSFYCELISHFYNSHRGTNNIFCPYCLKYFELPVQYNLTYCNIITFNSQPFYMHVSQHWNQTTHRCTSCRLDFIHHKDMKLHEYLHHAGQLDHSSYIVTEDEISTLNNKNLKSQLCLTYTNQLTTLTPRIGLRCLECGDSLRQPINRHFNLTLSCKSCMFASSCNASVNWHWCNVHSAPPIPQSSELSCELKCWQARIDLLDLKNEVKSKGILNSSFRPSSSLDIRIRRCKDKRSPPGLYSSGVLRCVCGFRTIVCDQMARHLANGDSKHSVAILDDSPRLSIFCIKSRKQLGTRRIMHPLRKSRELPFLLLSVGLS